MCDSNNKNEDSEMESKMMKQEIRYILRRDMTESVGSRAEKNSKEKMKEIGRETSIRYRDKKKKYTYT